MCHLKMKIIINVKLKRFLLHVSVSRFTCTVHARFLLEVSPLYNEMKYLDKICRIHTISNINPFLEKVLNIIV